MTSRRLPSAANVWTAMERVRRERVFWTRPHHARRSETCLSLVLP